MLDMWRTGRNSLSLLGRCTVGQVLLLYIRAVCTGVKNAPVYTGRTAEKHCEQCFFCTGRIYGSYIRVTGTHYPYIRPVHTGRIYGPYIWVLGTHYPYRIAVLYGSYIRIYGWFLRVVRIGLKGRYALPKSAYRP